MKIISLSGKAGSGKNTVAKIIAELASDKVYEVAYADALKEEVARACGVSVKFINKHKDNFRLILQGWGTDFRRKLDHDLYWIQKVDDKLVRLITINAQLIVITDARFKNELEYAHKCDAITVRVKRETDKKDLHPSEVDIDDGEYDFYLHNLTTIDFLKKQVKSLLINFNIPMKHEHTI